MPTYIAPAVSTLRRVGSVANANEQTVRRELAKPGSVRGDVGARIREALAMLGVGPQQAAPVTADDATKAAVEHHLKRHGNSFTEAAAALGCSFRTAFLIAVGRPVHPLDLANVREQLTALSQATA